MNGGSLTYGTNSCGTGMYGKCVLPYAFSVRCVLDLTTADGLQLCDWYESSKYGAAQCYPFYSGCQGGAQGTVWADGCFPAEVWLSNCTDRVCARALLNRGVLSSDSFTDALAFSVRCVPDLIRVLAAFL